MNGDVREVEEETVGLSYSVEGGGSSHFLPSAGPANWGPPWEVAGLQGSHQPMRYHPRSASVDDARRGDAEIRHFHGFGMVCVLRPGFKHRLLVLGSPPPQI